MSPSASSSSAKCSPGKYSATAAVVLLLSACSTTPQVSLPSQPSPLVVASCPLLPRLADDSFGAWVLWAQGAAGQYAKCREAALGSR